MKRVLLVLVAVGLLACNGRKEPPPEKVSVRGYSEGVPPVVVEDGDAQIYQTAVRLYNFAEYGTTGDITEDMVAATNWTEAHDTALYVLTAYLEVETNPPPMAMMLMGELHRRKDDHCGSLQFYEWAFQRGGRYVIHHAGVNLAYACLRCGKVDRAEEVVREMLRRKDVRFRTTAAEANLDITYCAGTVYMRRGHDAYNATNFAAAVEWYTKAHELRPEYPDWGCWLAEAWLRLAEEYNVEGGGKVEHEALVEAELVLNEEQYARWTSGRIQDLRDQVARDLGGR